MLRTVLLSSLLLPILLPFGTLAKDDHSHVWSYEPELNNDPPRWPALFKEYCGGTAQSPIDIVTSEVDYSDRLDGFDFSDNYDDPIIGAKIENNGHTIKITPGPNDTPRIFEEGGLDDKYQFLQLHFHWGSNSKQGSEHTIDGKAFPLEMHLVHKNMNYNETKALTKKDGLAVLAVLFKVDDEDNPALEPIIDKLDDVRTEGSHAELADSFNLFSLMPDDLMPYYRYRGSLTTPPCNEVVEWTVFKDFVPISEKQLNLFRDVKEEDTQKEIEPLVDNFRPVQPLHGRVVEVSGEGDNGAVSVASPTAMLVLSVLAFLM